MKLAMKKESGYIFPLVLILLAIGPLLIISMLHLSFSGQKFHQIVEINTLNAYAADSGIEYARYAIYNYPAEIQAFPLSEDLVINGIDVHVTAEWVYDAAAYMITSTASRAQRSCTIDCMIVVDVGLFGNIVACDGNLLIQNCEFVSDRLGESDVYAHGNIEVKSSYIDGDVKASGTVTLKSSTVTGDIIQGASVMQFPPIDPQIHIDKAKAGGTYNGNLNVSSDRDLGPLYINGNLTIGSGAHVTLKGTVYVTGYINITNANIYIPEGILGDMLAEGDIIMNNYTHNIENPITLPLLVTFGVDKTINIENDQGDPGTMAILYAPNGGINLTNVTIFGSVAAPEVVLSNAMIEYPAELRGRADLPGAGLDTVTYTFK